jgi:glycosyltransferase involved in cell wall biosynthesis
MKALKILYHHRTQGRGAEGVHISSIVKALQSMGHFVTVLSPPGIDPLSSAGDAPVDKSKVKTSGVGSLWKFISKHLPNFVFELIEMIYNLPSLRRLEKELSKNQYDIIYERYAFYMISGAIKAKKYNIPLVLEANEVSGIKDRARIQTFSSLCGVFERFLFKRCTSIHTVSSYLKEMIVKQGVTPEMVAVTPNAIDPNKFTGNKDFGELKQKYEIDKDATVIGFAGWFDNWDRLDLLVDVFYKLKQKHNKLKLLLVGDGAVLDKVKTKIEEYNIQQDVILTGAVSRDLVHQYLSLLDIAVITHSNEFGSPVVMFEFMGLKIPVVAPKLLPITDVLVNKKNALLFDILNMQQLQETLDILIIDKQLQGQLAQAAYEQLMAKHTWHNNAEEIVITAFPGK